MTAAQLHIDFERRQAIAELLAQPDPPELCRGHRLRLEGKAERFSMVQTIAAAYVQTRLLALQERRAEGTAEVQPRANIVWTLRLVRRREVAA
jgi:hypothetical protein